jgi:predicted LPLAT superfamily acyltransferase
MKDWSGRSLGSRLQHAIFYRLISLGGRKAAYALLFWVITWYTCKPSVQRRSAAYLQRRFAGASGLALWRHRWRLHMELGKCLVDRAAAGIDGTFSIVMDEAQKRRLQALHAEGRGLIFLAAHVGCWHMAMSGLADILPGRAAIVMHHDAGDVDRHYYEHRGEAPPFAIIDPGQGPYSSVAMLRCLQEGGVLALMGDRAFGNAPVCRVPFMGGKIAVPCAAYRLASASGAPVAVFFACRSAPGEARHVLAAILRVPGNLGKRAEACAPFARRYAELLEACAQEYPYQFFNFYNMWDEAGNGCERKAEKSPG